MRLEKSWTQEDLARAVGSSQSAIHRIEKGRQMLKKHQKLLKKFELKYGVPAHYLLAFWATETNFGEIKGQIDVLSALATLSYDERRSEFFSEQLIALLKILQKEKIDLPNGSWAGAFVKILIII